MKDIHAKESIWLAGMKDFYQLKSNEKLIRILKPIIHYRGDYGQPINFIINSLSPHLES